LGQGKGIQAFAQHGFQRVFPTVGNPYRLPQTRQFFELMLL
jgi:hypothetical protein